jgi:multiple sugar transport system ATP-binding protein
MSMAARICIKNRAKVLQIGTPADVYHRPATRFVAGFIGSPSMNFLEAAGRLTAGESHIQVNGASIAMPETREPLASKRAILGVRPEHIHISADGPLPGRVFAVEYMGARQLVTVDTSAGRLKVRASSDVRAKEGEAVSLAFDSASLVLFDPESDQAVDSTLFGGGRP